MLKKEREQIEEEKKKKLREVELWTRALREEEKIAIEKYAEQHGDKEIEQIQASIQDKISKELEDKKALTPAKPFFEAYMKSAMEKRNQEWNQKIKEFSTTKMDEFKDEILTLARDELRKVEIRRVTDQKARERAERDAEIARKKKEEGNADEQDDRLAAGEKSNAQIEENTWVRGANVNRDSPEKPRFTRGDGERPDRPPRARDGDEGGFLTRSDKPRAPAGEKPSFMRGPPRGDAGAKEESKDTGFVRGNFQSKKEDEPKKPSFSRGSKPAGSSDGPGLGFRNANKTAKK